MLLRNTTYHSQEPSSGYLLNRIADKRCGVAPHAWRIGGLLYASACDSGMARHPRGHFTCHGAALGPVPRGRFIRCGPSTRLKPSHSLRAMRPLHPLRPPTLVFSDSAEAKPLASGHAAPAGTPAPTPNTPRPFTTETPHRRIRLCTPHSSNALSVLHWRGLSPSSRCSFCGLRRRQRKRTPRR